MQTNAHRIMTKIALLYSIHLQAPPNVSMKICKKHISRVNYVHFLGALLDDHLNGKYHIAELSMNLAKLVAFSVGIGICFQQPHR